MPGALLYVARDFGEFGVQLLTAFMRRRCIDGAREQRVQEFDPAVGLHTNDASLFRRSQIGMIDQADRWLRERADFEQRFARARRQLAQALREELAQVVRDRQFLARHHVRR